MAIPATPTDTIWPEWANLVDTWREQDAEWLRNRTIQLFPDVNSRNTVMGASVTKLVNMLSAVQSGSVVGGPDFWTGTAWESVRYPNLNVTSDASSVTLKRQGAGTGISLLTDGSVNIAKGFLGTGGVGTTLDNTGVAIKIGTKSVKLSTDTAGLTIDSPVAIAGALSASGPLSAPSAVIPTISAPTSVTTPQASVGALTASGAIQGATVQGGTMLLTGNQAKATAGTAALTLAGDSSVSLAGASLTVAPATTMSAALTVNGATTFVGRPVISMTGYTPGVWVAGIIAAAGNVAPTQNAPDGTIYYTY